MGVRAVRKGGDNLTVYVVNKSGHSYKSAERYGKLEYLTEGYVNKFNVNSIWRQMEKKLKHSTPGDYLLPCSLGVSNMIAGAVFACKHGVLNLLVYQHGKYVERNLKIERKNRNGDK